MATVRDRICSVRENTQRICQRLVRDPAAITLVAVTKFATVAQVREAIEAGVTHIGENRVQDAKKRFAGLGIFAGQVTRHMIGHLQTNKVKDALAIFDMIQSVDSEKLLLEIDKRVAAEHRPFLEILIEVNSGEEQKSGVAKGDLMALVEKAAACEHIRVKGLMTMAPFVEDKAVIRQAFRDLRILNEKIAAQYQGHPRVEMKYLSMGMTSDYEIALEEGANMLRIGTAIFKE